MANLIMKIFYIIISLFIILCFNNIAVADEAPNQLQADKITYDKKRNMIVASGKVKIHYNGNFASCDNLYYTKSNQKILATGNVTLIDNKQNIIYSDKVDLTKDLNSGTIEKLQAKTTQDTYFSSDSAKRIDNGNVTIFNNATYTACKTCDFSDNKSCKVSSEPNQILWRIRAKQIIWNSKKKSLAFKHSQFDILNKTFFYLPNFTIPDYSVKRYSGFLPPSISYNNYLGYGVTAKYFFNLTPSYDLTLGLTEYSNQGLMGTTRWRQALHDGSYNINLAYIKQHTPTIFPQNTIDATKTDRYMLATKGDFKLNKYWSYGWDIFHQNDGDFSHSYNLKNYNNYTICSSVYLKGFGVKNSFDLNFYNFTVQDAYKNLNAEAQRHKYNQLQPWVLPQLNYGYIAPQPIFGGKLAVNTNLRAIYRSEDDFQTNIHPISIMVGSSTHLTSEVNWQKIYINKFGFVFKPLLALRGDIGTIYRAQTKINHGYAGKTYGLATAGLEVKYPISIKTKKIDQIVEPISQLFLRNNIDDADFLPNENAQEFNFNALSLFKRDKFSGTDRIEYGSRLNLGLRYTANINNILNIYAIAGQSIQLSKNNPFMQSNSYVNDFCYGLGKKYSDYVSSIQFNSANNFSLIFRNRFDSKSFKLKNNEIDFSKSWKNFSINAYYFSINKQLIDNTYGGAPRQLANSANIIFNKNWEISLYQNLDLTNNQFMNIGSKLHYQNDCVDISFNYTRNHPMDAKLASNSFGVHIALRTLLDVSNE